MNFDPKTGSPRSIRDKAKKIERAFQELEQKLGRAATDQEVCNELGLSLEEYHDMVTKVKAVTMLSIDDMVGPTQQDRKTLIECLENPSAKNPFTHLKSKGVRDTLMLNIEELPEKQKLVLSLYYYEGTKPERNRKNFGSYGVKGKPTPYSGGHQITRKT